jgi:hypothetical protein
VPIQIVYRRILFASVHLADCSSGHDDAAKKRKTSLTTSSRDSDGAGRVL